MQTDLVGRVNNYNLRASKAKALLPLFEAVFNSIQAIEEAEASDGHIEIKISRQTSLLEPSDFSPPIESFTIIDNGIGFDDAHYQSFQTSDSTFRKSKGGKGIGRFSWLKAFEHVEVSSIYQYADTFRKREFKFNLSKSPFSPHSDEACEERRRCTSIKLCNIKKAFRKAAPKNAKTIATRILEHCLIVFLRESPPQIIVRDEAEDESICLNDIFHSSIKQHSQKIKFKCKSYNLEINSLKIYQASDDSEHKIYLCAQGREVESEKLGKRIAALRQSKKIQDSNDEVFSYVGYVTGEILDQNVNAERTGFNIDKTIDEDETQLTLEDTISQEEILKEASFRAEEYLKEYLDSMSEESYQKTLGFIKQKRPQYRLLMSYRDKELKQLPSRNLSENQLDIELYKMYSDVEVELKEKSREFIEVLEEGDIEIEGRKDEYLQFIEESNAWGKSKLVDYVIHRKVILELFEKRLRANAAGKSNLEEDIHEIIFPLRRTSNEIASEQQNLWIIDERLSYHEYLASDKELKSMDPIETKSSKRPDIVIFDNRFAFVEGEHPYSSVVIIEFKRPMRDNYTNEDNPIAQVYSYVDIIRNGHAIDKNRQQILIDKDTPFYVYIICSITDKLKQQARMIPLTASSTGDGYFGYNPEYKTYLEIISFQKLVSDAKKRNAVLFDKLSIR